MSVKDQNGNILFTERRDYAVYDQHLPSNKDGWMGFDDWDLTAMTHINLGLEPLTEESQTYVVPMNADTTSVNIEASFIFEYEPGNSAVIETASKKIDFAE